MHQDLKHKIDTFLEEKSELPKIVVIYGPTASGKTGLSIEVAKYIGSEVISIDARQIYRHMDIGTGKVTAEEMQGISHHMLDIIDPSETFSVVDFRERVEKLPFWKRFLEFGGITKNRETEGDKLSESESEQGSRGALASEFLSPSAPFATFQGGKVEENSVGTGFLYRKGITPFGRRPTQEGRKNSEAPILTPHFREGGVIPVLCGGTGLYIDSLIFERSYPGIEADWTRREELEQFRLEHGNQALWDKLNAIDPAYAKTLHPNDRHYIIRGIEVFEKTGKSKAEIIDEPVLKYDTLFLTPYDGNREALYERINKRVQGMFTSGLVDEVQYIMNTFGSDCPGLATIGYKEVVEYLKGELTLDECITEVQQHNRNYAKRQITWNKKYGKCVNHAN